MAAVSSALISGRHGKLRRMPPGATFTVGGTRIVEEPESVSVVPSCGAAGEIFACK